MASAAGTGGLADAINSLAAWVRGLANGALSRAGDLGGPPMARLRDSLKGWRILRVEAFYNGVSGQVDGVQARQAAANDARPKHRDPARRHQLPWPLAVVVAATLIWVIVLKVMNSNSPLLIDDFNQPNG